MQSLWSKLEEDFDDSDEDKTKSFSFSKSVDKPILPMAETSFRPVGFGLASLNDPVDKPGNKQPDKPLAETSFRPVGFGLASLNDPVNDVSGNKQPDGFRSIGSPSKINETSMANNIGLSDTKPVANKEALLDDESTNLLDVLGLGIEKEKEGSKASMMFMERIPENTSASNTPLTPMSKVPSASIMGASLKKEGDSPLMQMNDIETSTAVPGSLRKDSKAPLFGRRARAAKASTNNQLSTDRLDFSRANDGSVQSKDDIWNAVLGNQDGSPLSRPTSMVQDAFSFANKVPSMSSNLSSGDTSRIMSKDIFGPGKDVMTGASSLLSVATSDQLSLKASIRQPSESYVNAVLEHYVKPSFFGENMKIEEIQQPEQPFKASSRNIITDSKPDVRKQNSKPDVPQQDTQPNILQQDSKPDMWQREPSVTINKISVPRTSRSSPDPTEHTNITGAPVIEQSPILLRAQTASSGQGTTQSDRQPTMSFIKETDINPTKAIIPQPAITIDTTPLTSIAQSIETHLQTRLAALETTIQTLLLSHHTFPPSITNTIEQLAQDTPTFWKQTKNEVHATSETLTLAIQNLEKTVDNVQINVVNFPQAIYETIEKIRVAMVSEERELWSQVATTWNDHKMAFEKVWEDGRTALEQERERFVREKTGFDDMRSVWEDQKANAIQSIEEERAKLASDRLLENQELERQRRQLSMDRAHWEQERVRLQREIHDLIERYNTIRTETIQMEHQRHSYQNDLARLQHEIAGLRQVQVSFERQEVDARKMAESSVKRNDEASRMLEEAQKLRNEAIEIRRQAAEERRRLLEQQSKFDRMRLDMLKNNTKRSTPVRPRSVSKRIPLHPRISSPSSTLRMHEYESRGTETTTERGKYEMEPRKNVARVPESRNVALDEEKQFLSEAYHRLLIPSHHRAALTDK